MKNLLICLNTGKDYEITVDEQTFKAFKHAVENREYLFGFSTNNEGKEIVILLNNIIAIEISDFRD